MGAVFEDITQVSERIDVDLPILYSRPNDGSNFWNSILAYVGSKGLTDCQRPNDGSKVAKRSFKSHVQEEPGKQKRRSCRAQELARRSGPRKGAKEKGQGYGTQGESG
jgi:hypothetical protein